MPKFTVTGAAGQVGLQIVRELLNRNIAPTDIIAVAHDNPFGGGAVDEITELGVEVRQTDLTKTDGLADVFAGTNLLMLLPYTGLDNFEPNNDDTLIRNRNALNAAKAAGATWAGYISGVRAAEENADVFPAHSETEGFIKGLFPGSYTIMRAGLQAERYGTGEYTIGLDGDEPGVAGLALNGQVSTIARADLGSAVGQLFVTHPKEGVTLELVSETNFSEAAFITFISARLGKEVKFQELTEAEYRTFIGTLETSDPESALALELAIRDGRMTSDSKDLRKVLGRPPVSSEEALKDFFKDAFGG